MTVARVIGPALAGLLIATVGYSWASLLDGLSYIAVIIALAMDPARELRRRPSPSAARVRCARASPTCAACPTCGSRS